MPTMNPATAMRREALVKKVTDAIVMANREGLSVRLLLADAEQQALDDPRWVPGDLNG